MKSDVKRKPGSVAAACCMALAVSACASVKTGNPGPVVTAPDLAAGQQDYSNDVAANYTLRATDTIKVTVFREPALSVDNVTLSADGQFSMPLVGTVNAGGMTPMQLEAQLERALNERYLRNPDVTVNVVQYASHKVTVEGGVKNPGLYDFQPGTRLSGALALANGMDRVGKPADIAVFRQSPDGPMVAKFNYQMVREGTMLDPVLQPGDRIVVGTSSLSQAWQDLLQAIPLFALFTRF